MTPTSKNQSEVRSGARVEEDLPRTEGASSEVRAGARVEEDVPKSPWTAEDHELLDRAKNEKGPVGGALGAGLGGTAAANGE